MERTKYSENVSKFYQIKSSLIKIASTTPHSAVPSSRGTSTMHRMVPPHHDAVVPRRRFDHPPWRLRPVAIEHSPPWRRFRLALRLTPHGAVVLMRSAVGTARGAVILWQ